MSSGLIPADDEAFALGNFIDFTAFDSDEEPIGPSFWVSTVGKAVNLDINYAYRSIDVYIAPEDAERLGILLQFAARQVMDARDGNA